MVDLFLKEQTDICHYFDISNMHGHDDNSQFSAASIDLQADFQFHITVLETKSHQQEKREAFLAQNIKTIPLSKFRSLSDSSNEHRIDPGNDDADRKLIKRHTFGGEKSKQPLVFQKLYQNKPLRGGEIVDATQVKNRLPDFVVTKKSLLSSKLCKKNPLSPDSRQRSRTKRRASCAGAFDNASKTESKSTPKRSISMCLNPLNSPNRHEFQNRAEGLNTRHIIGVHNLKKIPTVKISVKTSATERSVGLGMEGSTTCSTMSLREDGKRDEMQNAVMETVDGNLDDWQSASDSNMEDVKQLKLPKRSRPIDRFRKIVRLLCFLLKIKSSTDRKYNQPKHTVFEQLQELAEAGVKSEDGMVFDPKYFKAVREIKLSHDAVQILSMEPGTRTEDQIQAALSGLKASVSAFGEYPLKMQKRLVTVGWYERFEAKRVIIRQGHRAENFYFILSGTALVTLLIADQSTGEQRPNTIAVLGKGSSFGELALLHHKSRSATVLCKDEVALLAVSREDFRDIFMSYEDGKEPDHIRFLRTIPYLKGLPLDQCATRHDLCIFHYFRRGVVIVKNSNTDWIYIIKTQMLAKFYPTERDSEGSCRVLTNLEKRTSKREKEKLLSLPVIPVDEVERRNVLYTASGERRLPPVAWSPDTKRPRTEPSTRNEREDLTLPAIGADQDRFKRTAKKVNFALPWIDRLNSRERAQTQIDDHRNRIEKLHRKITQSNLKNGSNVNNDDNNDDKSTKTEHVCVQIELLKPKDQFGLSSVLHDNLAVQCHLVSNGAECILIKKSWFLQNAGESILRTLRGQISPYPTQDTLEQNLQDQANWESFKSQTINDLLDTLHL